MAKVPETEYQKASDPTIAGYDGLVKTKRDVNDNVQLISIPSGKNAYILDSAGRVISQVDEATGDVTRTRFADGALGPVHTLIHDSASPAADDVLGKFAFKGRNSSAALYAGVEIRAIAKNVTAGSEEVWFEAGIMVAGTFVPAGMSLRVVGGEIKLYLDGAELTAGTADPIGATAYNSANQAITTGTRTAVNLPNEVRDDGGLHSNVTDTYKMTIPAGEDGWYSIFGHVLWGATPTFGVVEIMKNGIASTDRIALNNTSNQNMGVSGIAYLVAGDWIALSVRHDKGSSENVIFTTGYPNVSLTFLTIAKVS